MKNMHREHLCSRVHVFYFRLIGRQPVSEMERSGIELKHGSYLFIGRQPYIESRQSRDEMAWLEEPQRSAVIPNIPLPMLRIPEWNALPFL